MITLLSEKRDRALTQSWAIWLTKRDPDSGLKASSILIHSEIENQSNENFQLLMPRDSGKRREKADEDIALLEQIQGANPAAAVRYLEYLVLQRRSTVCSWLYY